MKYKPNTRTVLKSFMAGLIVKLSPGVVSRVTGVTFDNKVYKAAAGGAVGYAAGVVMNDPEIRDICLGLAGAEVAEDFTADLLGSAVDMIVPGADTQPYLAGNAANYGYIPSGLAEYTNEVSMPDDYSIFHRR